MAWVRMDDGYPEHPKVDIAGPLAAWLNVCAWAYCARNLTDGFVPKDRVARLTQVPKPERLATALMQVGLWESAADPCARCVIKRQEVNAAPIPGVGYVVHDYLSYNPSREQVLAEREMHQVRKDLYADPFMRTRIKKRDGDQCRYCGKTVVWVDRKSPIGGTYDHVDPHGGNSDDNLVVACRGCNSRKGQRTPQEARMPLLPPTGESTVNLNGTTQISSRDQVGIKAEIQQPVNIPARPVGPGPGDDDPIPQERGPDVAPRRAAQTNPRAEGTNPRALGTNPRALGTNPRAVDDDAETVPPKWEEIVPGVHRGRPNGQGEVTLLRVRCPQCEKVLTPAEVDEHECIPVGQKIHPHATPGNLGALLPKRKPRTDDQKAAEAELAKIEREKADRGPVELPPDLVKLDAEIRAKAARNGAKEEP